MTSRFSVMSPPVNTGMPVICRTFRIIDGISPGDIPREDNLYLDCTVLETVTPQCGPGLDYTPCAFTIDEGTTVSVVDYENGYAMCELDFGGKHNWRRFWINVDMLYLQ